MRPTLFAEVKRRKVLRVALAYAIVALAVMEAADLILPALYLPDWAYRLIVILAVLGFPIAVSLAWAFEITPEGVRRERDADGAIEWTIEAYRMSPLGVEMRVLESPLFSRVRINPRYRREVSRERQRLWDKVKKASRQIM